jgi:hypothetical protein
MHVFYLGLQDFLKKKKSLCHRLAVNAHFEDQLNKADFFNEN